MKNSILITSALICVVFLFSCKKEALEPQSNYQWTKIVVPGASTIYSMSGNIRDELIIGGLGEIRKTTDGGSIWSIVQDSVTAYELRKSQDTLFAIALYNPSYLDYYSLNNGSTWNSHNDKIFEDSRVNSVTNSNGTIYKIVDPGTYPKQPDQVMKSSDGGSTWIDVFPYKRYIYSIYLDDDDRLYVGVNGWDSDANTNSFDFKLTDTNSGEHNGYIYYLEE